MGYIFSHMEKEHTPSYFRDGWCCRKYMQRIQVCDSFWNEQEHLVIHLNVRGRRLTGILVHHVEEVLVIRAQWKRMIFPSIPMQPPTQKKRCYECKWQKVIMGKGSRECHLIVNPKKPLQFAEFPSLNHSFDFLPPSSWDKLLSHSHTENEINDTVPTFHAFKFCELFHLRSPK